MVKIHLTLNHLKRWYIEHFIFYMAHSGFYGCVLLSGPVGVSSSHSKPSKSHSFLSLSSLPVTAPKGTGAVVWEDRPKPSCLIQRQKGIKEQGAGSPRAPRQQLSGEQASFVTHHRVLLHSPAATVAFPATLGCLVRSDPV